MPAPGDGLYRAVLVGEWGELPLGVMEPDGGQLRFFRRPYQRDVASLGKILRGEAMRSFAFSGSRGWQRTQRPMELFRSKWLRESLEHCDAALWKREREVLCLALPYDPMRHFPLDKLFCLARVERMEGKRWVVYRFDGEECPLQQENT